MRENYDSGNFGAAKEVRVGIWRVVWTHSFRKEGLLEV